MPDSVHHLVVFSSVVGVSATGCNLYCMGGVPISARISGTETTGECEKVARFCPFLRDSSRASSSASFSKRRVFLQVVLRKSG